MNDIITQLRAIGGPINEKAAGAIERLRDAVERYEKAIAHVECDDMADEYIDQARALASLNCDEGKE